MIAIIRRLLVLLVRILVGARNDWRGCAPDPRRRFYFANHSSHFDTVAVIAALPWSVRRLTHPVAASDYWARAGSGNSLPKGACALFWSTESHVCTAIRLVRWKDCSGRVVLS
jgi:hypothetical protein